MTTGRMLTGGSVGTESPLANVSSSLRVPSGELDDVSCTDSPVAAVDARFLTCPVIVMVWPCCAYDGLTEKTLTASGCAGGWLRGTASAVALSNGRAAQNPPIAVTNDARATRFRGVRRRARRAA